MTKKILTAAALLAASSFAAFTTWHGDEGVYQVETGLGNTTKTHGYFFDYADNGDGGQSAVSYPASKGNEYSDGAMDPIIDACKGVCGTAALKKGTLDYSPFIGIGINVVGETDATNSTPAAGDASDWGGLCIAYSTTSGGASLELGLGDAVDATIGSGNPFISLPKGDGKVVNAAWSEFKMQSWAVDKYTELYTGETAAKQLVAVKFKIQDAEGNYTFNIMSLGANNGGCTATTGGANPDVGPTPNPNPNPTPDAIVMGSAAAPVKAMLSGRTLSFSGINSAAAVEVVNLQGRVVVKGSAASSLNLANLDAGIYMVRVAGKSVDFAQKIVLK